MPQFSCHLKFRYNVVCLYVFTECVDFTFGLLLICFLSWKNVKKSIVSPFSVLRFDILIVIMY